MKNTHLIAAATIALGLAQGAHARTTDWGVHDPIEFGDHIILTQRSFEDSFTFSLTDATTFLDATAVSNNLGRAFRITDGLVQLYEVAPGPDTLIGSFSFDGTTGDTSHSFGGLSSGDYYYLVTGNTVGRAGGWYSLTSAIAPVPEPHVMSLMLAGLGVLGMVALRRRPRDAR